MNEATDSQFQIGLHLESSEHFQKRFEADDFHAIASGVRLVTGIDYELARCLHIVGRESRLRRQLTIYTLEISANN